MFESDGRCIFHSSWLFSTPSCSAARLAADWPKHISVASLSEETDSTASWIPAGYAGDVADVRALRAWPSSRATSTTTNTVLLYCTLDSIIGSDYTANMIVKIGVQLLLSVSLRPTAQKSIHGS
jgi:hypothetical protein